MSSEGVFPLKLKHENGGELIARDEIQLSAFKKHGFEVVQETEQVNKKKKKK